MELLAVESIAFVSYRQKNKINFNNSGIKSVGKGSVR